MRTNLVPSAFPLITHFLRENPWGRGWRLASLAQIRELARRLCPWRKESPYIFSKFSPVHTPVSFYAPLSVCINGLGLCF